MSYRPLGYNGTIKDAALVLYRRHVRRLCGIKAAMTTYDKQARTMR